MFFILLIISSSFVNSFFCNYKYNHNLNSLFFSKKKIDDGISLKSLSPVYKPKTYNQQLYFKYLLDYDIPIVLGVGPAGSGKTLFACYSAVNALKKGIVNKIILTRPVVTVEEDIGFLPGNLIRKMDPWTRPIFDILLEFYKQSDIDLMLHNGIIEISPLAFMRGRTFKNAFIIADEMQNSSPNQMLMLTTRIGENSKMVITGDLKQSDRLINNGLSDFINKLEIFNSHSQVNDIRLIIMNSTDIQRNPVVSKVINIYSNTSSHNELFITNNYNSSSNSTNCIKYSSDSALIPFHHL